MGVSLPVAPSGENVTAIARKLDLTEQQKRALRVFFDDFARDVEARVREHEHRPLRRKLANRLKRIEKALRKIHQEVQNSGDLLDDLVPRDIGDRLGAQLTFSAISEAVQEEKLPLNFEVFRQEVAERDGGLTMSALEKIFVFQRRTLGVMYGAILFRRMINDLYCPFRRWVETDKGPKPKFFRNLVIQRLAASSMDIIGKMASSSPGGRFTSLCAEVLTAMRLTTDLVEKAVKVELRKRNRKWKRARS
jgi:hypothetical protein